ncbi:hypothetical protein V5799_022937 [Amblyomma americanum]|uniref:Secreted protein n=1 Tax=Amblyomma americanum TaxID=6943 RepID=A0AAQ4FKQ0_AMBAM
MKNLAVVLAVLLFAVSMVEAQRYPGRSGVERTGPGRRCGEQVCHLGKRCVEMPLLCRGALCLERFHCI